MVVLMAVWILSQPWVMSSSASSEESFALSEAEKTPLSVSDDEG